MKERPMLFSGPMVRAILEGRKTQTRRAVQPQPTQLVHLSNGETVSEAPYWTWRPRSNKGKCLGTTEKILKEVILAMCPYGVSGDRLWVREAFQFVQANSDGQRSTFKSSSQFTVHDYRWIEYAATPRKDEPAPIWKPSIHMPRWASRLTLEITGVRVERLQEISEVDAMAEGVNWKDFAGLASKTAKKLYADLWDSINGKKHPWESNPWVWVIEFKQL